MGSFREGDVKGTTSQSSYNISHFSYLHLLLANVFIFTFLKVGGTVAQVKIQVKFWKEAVSDKIRELLYFCQLDSHPLKV